MFESTKNIIKKVVNQKGFAQTAESSHVCFEADKIISATFPRIKSKINIVSFQKGILKIASPSGAINQEIHIKEKELIKKINQKLKQDLVKRFWYCLRTS